MVGEARYEQIMRGMGR